jgi:hypothetical protein
VTPGQVRGCVRMSDLTRSSFQTIS